MKTIVPALAVLIFAAGSLCAADRPALPFESEGESTSANAVDALVLDPLKAASIAPARPSSDEVFVRRVYIDALGVLPTPDEVQAFMDDRRREKRAALVDALLERDEFADYHALKWCDALRVKAEYPINLWPNAVQAYQRWIHDSMRADKPFDQFARELLTATGSNFRDPPSNFYRAVQNRTPAGIASAVALTFMGTRIERWPQSRRDDMAAFFSRVRYKSTGEWKEEIVYLDPEHTEEMSCRLPDGTRLTVKAGDDARAVFADWLLSKDDPYFAENAVNRVWASLMGRGIVNEVDDIRPDNPPSNPALMAYLAKELVSSNYDLKHIFKLILKSRTYQGSCIPASSDPRAEALFAYYPVRRLDAEVLIDALDAITGTHEGYSSQTPEPYTYVPEEEPTVDLADGSISSEFLEMFGRPSRDTGLVSERSGDTSRAQRLHLLNSTHIQKKIETGPAMQELLRAAGGDRDEVIRLLYLTILSRAPMPSESEAAAAYFRDSKLGLTQAADDLAWALINSKEFLYKH